MPNESVGKVLLTSETEVFGGHLTLPKYEIVDCGAFYEVTFFCISPKNLLGNFSTASTLKISRRHKRSAGLVYYPVFEINSPSIYR
jgi:hypothetical protein